jgi:hypothetical protein
MSMSAGRLVALWYLFQAFVYGQEALHLSTRAQVKTKKVEGDIHHHLVLNESDYGNYQGLRPVEKAAPARNAPCIRRASDNKWACYPDVIYIGTSKSGTTSMAAHLAFDPMVQNILSKKESARRKSKEGHFWEIENTGRKGFNASAISDVERWVNFTKNEIIELQEGFDNIEDRPILIEYSPNYFVLDHVPEILKAAFPYPLKFVVSLRDPIGRAISSWKFKANEGLKLNEARKKRGEHVWADDPFNMTMKAGIDQAHCVISCYAKLKSMKECSMTKCRAKFDKRTDGRNGKYSYYAHVVKSLYAYQFLMWFEYFPKSSFFIFTIEQYRKDPIGVTEAVLDFMGLPLYDPAGKYGFKDKQQLINVLSVIMNETPVAVLLEEQITKKDLAILKTFFAHQDTKLKEVLGWEKGYYDPESIAAGTNTTPAAAAAVSVVSAAAAAAATPSASATATATATATAPVMTPPKARLRS